MSTSVFVNEFVDLQSRLTGFPNSSQRVRRSFLTDLGKALREEIIFEIRSGTGGTRSRSPRNWTGTYAQSIRSEVVEGPTGANLLIRLVPTGEEADRLPIYWKVLELGAAPNPDIPTEKIMEWSVGKFGTEQIGSSVIGRNITLSRLQEEAANPSLDQLFAGPPDVSPYGIFPNPILGLFFKLDGSLRVMGVTPRTQTFIDSMLKLFLRDLTEDTLGRAQRRDPGSGRFMPRSIT